MFDSFNVHTSLLNSYERIKQERWKNSPSWLSVIRENGRILFEEMGIPRRYQEEWKYTDLSAISSYSFLPSNAIASHTIETLGNNLMKIIPRYEAVSPITLVFLNGFFAPELSQGSLLQLEPDGVEVESLARAINRNNHLTEEHLAVYALPEENSFVALNSAFIEDGAYIHIPEGVKLERPIHLIYINNINSGNGLDPKKTGNANENWASYAHHFHPRNLIILEKGASASIIEDYRGYDPGVYLNNPVTEIVLRESSELGYFKFQRENPEAFQIGLTHVHQEAQSRLTSFTVTTGGNLIRNNIDVYLVGSEASCILNGLYAIEGKQHVDNHTLIEHQAPHCTSRELYHGILNGNARGVFNGKIYVHRDAQKTDSKQEVRSLMLSDDAIVNAKPQLEIFADDVKCSHGATVGQLDEDSIYYLRSRGIDAQTAKKMLVHAFAGEIVSRFPNYLQSSFFESMGTPQKEV